MIDAKLREQFPLTCWRIDVGLTELKAVSRWAKPWGDGYAVLDGTNYRGNPLTSRITARSFHPTAAEAWAAHAEWINDKVRRLTEDLKEAQAEAAATQAEIDLVVTR
jgi:hypothetical protein